MKRTRTQRAGPSVHQRPRAAPRRATAARAHARTRLLARSHTSDRARAQAGHAGAGTFHDDVFILHVPSGRWTRCRPAGPATAAGPGPRGWFAAARLPAAAPAAAAAGGAAVDGDAADGEERVAVFGGLAEDNARLGDGWVCHVRG